MALAWEKTLTAALRPSGAVSSVIDAGVSTVQGKPQI
jgi:hypothetical protein